MATTIVRRKRSRNEFDTENIDVIAIGTVGCAQPRKKPRRTITTKPITTPTHTITTQAKKRSYSQTDFSQNTNDYKVLKERSPNKKIKTTNNYSMMIDNEDESENENENEIGSKSIIKIDFEGDALMESIHEKNKIRSTFHIDFIPGTKRRNKQKYPPNRIRRSGLAFCVECGIGK